MTTKRKRARPGDILEVSTPRGLAYIHYTARHPEYGDAIRVLPGFFTTRPADFTALANSPEAYFTFYPAGVAVSQRVVEVVARIPVPPGQELPFFYRRRGASNREGRILTWFIWDGTKDTLVRELSEAERLLPIASIWNHEALLYYLTREWRPEQDIGIPLEPEDTTGAWEKPKSSDSSMDDSTPQRVQHYLYFPSAKASKEVAAQLAAQDFKVDRRKSDSGANWLVLVEHAVVLGAPALDSVRETLERLAQEHSGEYDGHQTVLAPEPE
ncbi:ribonuclease E inhibitor RraB [Archangium sp.]|uniref:ribonuclease E inhibitor RraB n=1 Tax=Archangium sp. TaxID=1872627 RepID=UPI002D23A340|nr:ribonuclease E inhibitor RraB [Archangium sp.]HYO54193.1 ribonuclease E inhibitor RraB [Archangium sp.]